MSQMSISYPLFNHSGPLPAAPRSLRPTAPTLGKLRPPAPGRLHPPAPGRLHAPTAQGLHPPSPEIAPSAMLSWRETIKQSPYRQKAPQPAPRKTVIQASLQELQNTLQMSTTLQQQSSPKEVVQQAIQGTPLQKVTPPSAALKEAMRPSMRTLHSQQAMPPTTALVGSPLHANLVQTTARSSAQLSSQTTPILTVPKLSSFQTAPKPPSIQTPPRPSSIQTSPWPSVIQTSPRPSSIQTSPRPSVIQTSPRPAVIQTSPRPSPRPFMIQTSPRPSSSLPSPMCPRVPAFPPVPPLMQPVRHWAQPTMSIQQVSGENMLVMVLPLLPPRSLRPTSLNLQIRPSVMPGQYPVAQLMERNHGYPYKESRGRANYTRQFGEMSS